MTRLPDYVPTPRNRAPLAPLMTSAHITRRCVDSDHVEQAGRYARALQNGFEFGADIDRLLGQADPGIALARRDLKFMQGAGRLTNRLGAELCTVRSHQLTEVMRAIHLEFYARLDFWVRVTVRRYEDIYAGCCWSCDQADLADQSQMRVSQREQTHASDQSALTYASSVVAAIQNIELVLRDIHATEHPADKTRLRGRVQQAIDNLIELDDLAAKVVSRITINGLTSFHDVTHESLATAISAAERQVAEATPGAHGRWPRADGTDAPTRTRTSR